MALDEHEVKFIILYVNPFVLIVKLFFQESLKVGDTRPGDLGTGADSFGTSG
jgi:hypothetical protein